MAINGNLPPIDFFALSEELRIERLRVIHANQNQPATTLSLALFEVLQRGDTHVDFKGNVEIEKAIDNLTIFAVGLFSDVNTHFYRWDSREQIVRTLQGLQGLIQDNNSKLQKTQ